MTVSPERAPSGAIRVMLPDGRWHFQHGPIDLVIAADGDPSALAAAHAQAWQRFAPLLGELVAELPVLRAPVTAADALTPAMAPGGAVARRMWRACQPHAAQFITAMAAVAGAVADELIGCYRREGIARAAINNGGDIALHLHGDATWRVGVCAAPVLSGSVPLAGTLTIAAADGIGGVATSGWRGRSFSLGIADAVTVLAADAAGADAAATMIANAVDTDDARIVRAPATQRRADSDLGDRLVTVDVPALAPAVIADALARGAAHARALVGAGLIGGAVLICQGQAVCVGPALAASPLPSHHSAPMRMPLAAAA